MTTLTLASMSFKEILDFNLSLKTLFTSVNQNLFCWHFVICHITNDTSIYPQTFQEIQIYNLGWNCWNLWTNNLFKPKTKCSKILEKSISTTEYIELKRVTPSSICQWSVRNPSHGQIGQSPQSREVQQ